MGFIEDNLNTIILGDCLDVMKQIPDKSIDLVLTDPPYGINIVDEFQNTIKSKTSMFNMSNGICGESEWDSKIPDKIYFDEIFRISKNQIIWGGNYFLQYFYNTRCFLVWDKMNGTNPMADCELAWTSFNRSIRKFSMHHFSSGYGKKEHPTQKPLKLFKWCLQQSGLEKGLILDCFSGSGTTAIAASEMGFDFICIEKDQDYHAASVKRLEDFKKQLTLF